MKNPTRETIKGKIAPPGKWFAADLNLEIIEDYIQPITLNAIGCKYDGAKQVLGLLFNIKRRWYVWIPKWDDLWDTCFLGTYIEYHNKGNTDNFIELANEILSLVKPLHTIIDENKGNYQKEVQEGIRLDIVEVVSQYANLTKAGQTLRGPCPFHRDSGRGSFFVYPERQSWHCFGACNTGGDVFSFIERLKKQDTPPLKLSNLRIIKSNPPHYKLNINDKDLILNTQDLLQWGRFRSKILAGLNILPEKPRNWEKVVSDLLQHAEMINVPIDANEETEVKLSVKRWFEQRGEGKEYSDIQAGCYIPVSYLSKETNSEEKKFRAFQATPLLRWLKRDLGKTITRDNLWAIVSEYGGIHHQWRVGGESIPVRLWALPEEWF